MAHGKNKDVSILVLVDYSFRRRNLRNVLIYRQILIFVIELKYALFSSAYSKILAKSFQISDIESAYLFNP